MGQLAWSGHVGSCLIPSHSSSIRASRAHEERWEGEGPSLALRTLAQLSRVVLQEPEKKRLWRRQCGLIFLIAQYFSVFDALCSYVFPSLNLKCQSFRLTLCLKSCFFFPPVFISHSSSRIQLKFLFQSVLPRTLGSLTDKLLVDVGSRLGAVLYGVCKFYKSFIGLVTPLVFCPVSSLLILPRPS